VTDSDELRALRESVRALLAKRSDVRAAIETPLGYDDKLWSTLCEQIGVAALAIPESYGGIGAGPAALAVVLEELGRTLTPCPMLGSVLFTQALLATGNTEACARLLPGIADGSQVGAVAWAGESGWASPGCAVSGSIVDGSARYVLDGDFADILLVLARTGDDAGLFEVSTSDVSRRLTPGMDPTRRLAAVDFSGTPATRLDRGGFPVETLRNSMWAALAAEQVGVAGRALELTVEYTKQRRQFGRPIGSFQALKHRMADVFVRVEAARSAALAALSGQAEDAAMAKVVCSEAAEFATAEMIQLHGGIAITWEHDAHLYFKRAQGSGQLFGAVREAVESREWAGS